MMLCRLTQTVARREFRDAVRLQPPPSVQIGSWAFLACQNSADVFNVSSRLKKGYVGSLTGRTTRRGSQNTHTKHVLRVRAAEHYRHTPLKLSERQIPHLLGARIGPPCEKYSCSFTS
eukprot:1156318-Pelagomonas_calceolata.AAC.2